MLVAGLDMAVDDRVVLAVNGTMTKGKKPSAYHYALCRPRLDQCG